MTSNGLPADVPSHLPNLDLWNAVGTETIRTCWVDLSYRLGWRDMGGAGWIFCDFILVFQHAGVVDGELCGRLQRRLSRCARLPGFVGVLCAIAVRADVRVSRRIVA